MNKLLVLGIIFFTTLMSQATEYKENIHYEILARDIHELIENSRFKKFNEIDEFTSVTRLKKIDINEVYGFMVDELLKKYSRIDLFSELCNYFNIPPNKFYNSLSNISNIDAISNYDNPN